MAQLTIHIEDVSRELWQVFGQYQSWKSDSAKCEDIKRRLSHFNDSHSADSKHIDNVIKALSRGLYLIKSGAEWHDPAVGHQSSENPNDTHKARGIQWRLVIIWSGFEILTKTLLIDKKRGLGSEQFSKFTEKCGLNSYKLLSSPNKELKKLNIWLDNQQEVNKIVDFMNVTKGDAKIIENWIINEQPISTWVDALQLAKALRNATAHGTLSASKVKQWGLQKPILILTENIEEIVVAGMQKLIYL